MATQWGNQGTVRIGAGGSTAIAEIIEFEFTQTVAPIDDTAMGDQWKTHIAGSGIREWSGTLTCHWDETDTAGQQTLVAGASVTLGLYPEGNQTTDRFFSGLATITEVTITTQMEGSTIRRTFTFMGNGPLTEAAVA